MGSIAPLVLCVAILNAIQTQTGASVTPVNWDQKKAMIEECCQDVLRFDNFSDSFKTCFSRKLYQTAEDDTEIVVQLIKQKCIEAVSDEDAGKLKQCIRRKKNCIKSQQRKLHATFMRKQFEAPEYCDDYSETVLELWREVTAELPCSSIPG